MEKSRYRSIQQPQEIFLSEFEKLFVADIPELNEYITSLVERKLKFPSVRSYFPFWMYKYVEQCAKAEGCSFQSLDKETSEVKIPFVAEAIASVMYLHNRIFDKKQKVKNTSCNLLRCDLLKDRIYDYIDEQFTAKNQYHMQHYVRRIFRCVDVGQYFDKFYSSATLLEGNEPFIFEDKSLEHFISLDAIKDIIVEAQKEVKCRKDAIAIYFERNYLTSSALFRYLTELILTLTGYEGKEKNNVIQFAECYGFMMQLNDDISDFVGARGTSNNISEDVLTDAKKGTITLPMLLHLRTAPQNNLLRRFLNYPETEIEEGIHNELLKEMIFSKAHSKAMQIGTFIAERAHSLLIQRNVESYLKLADLLSGSYDNKYYYHIHQANKFYERPENRKRLYRCEGDVTENSMKHKEEELEADIYPRNQFWVIRSRKNKAKKLTIAAT